MRQVKVTRSIYRANTTRVYYYKVKMPDYINDELTGIFHQFAQEREDGCMSVVAVVELEDGAIITPHVSAVRFIKSDTAPPICAGEECDY